MCRNADATPSAPHASLVATTRETGAKGGTMRRLFDIVSAFAIGAAVLLGIGLAIQVTSAALELVALR
jgi:hypothetical protein